MSTERFSTMSGWLFAIVNGRGGSTRGCSGFSSGGSSSRPTTVRLRYLGLPEPLGVHATYLVRDSFVLELIDYSQREVHVGAERVMDQVGLTHLSFSVSDLAGALVRVEEFGGAVVEGTVTEGSAMIRDPDGQLLELLSDGWLAVLPARLM